MSKFPLLEGLATGLDFRPPRGCRRLSLIREVLQFTGPRAHWMAAAGVLMVRLSAGPIAPLPEELGEAERWAAAKTGEPTGGSNRESAVIVWANHDPVQKNSRSGKPLRIAHQEFQRGLYCHAPSRLEVRLPGPAKSFAAIIGVDSNSQTSGGRGSVEFVVAIGDEEKFRSGLMREGVPGASVGVGLGGKQEFVLSVEPTSDGIACDQANWAEARVLLEDGRELWLADLPLRTGGPRADHTAELPFSFVYDGKHSRDLLNGWESAVVAGETRSGAKSGRIEHSRTWHDPETRLEVRWEMVRYGDFPTVEWTVLFKNTGDRDTPILSAIEALDTIIDRTGGPAFLLHHHKGTFVRADDFEPLSTRLNPGDKIRFAPPGGRPLGHVFPYFNLEQQPDEGVIVAVGWPGQWRAEFACDQAAGLTIRAGQEQTHLRLRPGEEIRTPLVVLQFWRGDWIRSQNIWRRWMLAHNLPRPEGREPKPLLTPCSSHQFAEMIHANEENQKLFIDRYLEERLNPDYWWMDAGWYVHHGGGWPRTGTWEVDHDRFPRGLRAITDHAHAKGLKTIVWFEPERVTPGTFLYTNNPAWLLGHDGQQKLLNLGNPEARAWLTAHVDRMLTEQGIDLYRQDYNIDPLGYWRDADAGDRQGITENHYVTGYLAYWDELRRRHPELLIDSCASGGHRNDLETMRRSLPFLRSDFIFDPVGNQGHTYGLSFWLPYHGTGARHLEEYALRSAMGCPHFIACWDLRDTSLDYDFLRRIVSEWRQYADCYLGDYYPLTPYTNAKDAWMAWQFDRPEQGRGVVQAFRRAESIYEVARLKLQNLEASAIYRVTTLGPTNASTDLSGDEMIQKGLRVEASAAPTAVVMVYERLR